MLPHASSFWSGLILLTPSLLAQISPVDQAPTSSPLLVLSQGDSKWALLGCYNELQANESARALGATGSYFSPDVPPDNLTVPLCLGGCGATLSPNGGGPYIYAGVENSRECFCGLTLSNISTIRDDGYCSSPCTGDSQTSCGGFGYLVLYELRSELNTTNSSSPTPTSSSTPSQSTTLPLAPTSGKNNTGMWVGIGIGIFVLLLIIAILLWYSIRRHRRQQAQIALNTAGISTSNENKPVPTLRRQPTTGGNDGRRNGIIDDGDQYYVSPQSTLPGGISPRNRDTFDVWKKGFVPPLSPDDVIGPVEVGNGAGIRKGTIDHGSREPMGSEESGIGSLGLNYVDERLAELEAVEKGGSDVASGSSSFGGGGGEILESPILGRATGGVVRMVGGVGEQDISPLSGGQTGGSFSGDSGLRSERGVVEREGEDKMTWVGEDGLESESE